MFGEHTPEAPAPGGTLAATNVPGLVIAERDGHQSTCPGSDGRLDFRLPTESPIETVDGLHAAHWLAT